ncbi:uncharacterized protein LOC129950801 [Eupeodes corollae]|uniref:uncharacterized protein LOC129950801 n=1 Tax=Eupeodes corollae TaxID=290404 RepID=UPI002492BCC1|nr:uncharacterized protein LOC129950801 [Eupeodes corollae]
MSKVLKDLIVTELKAKLSKRGLSGTGVKNELVKRLQEHLEQHKEDPYTFAFELEAKVEEVNTNVALSKMVLVLLAKLEENEKNFLKQLETQSKQLEAQRSNQKQEQQNILERGSAAELLQTVLAEKSCDFTVVANAIEQRFKNSHMAEVFRVQLYNRTQKRGETLQKL